eukprot:TRINITY_DN63676_c0_g1_i1.p1 TRINITY_DN63676_c0_g1~~TRINITY_DN63676_c0_g1_i1.p1  ORF type:complete len:372 (-),score=94.89 TRINITY_DN63676_c0_g1_i1:84-1166(-)
MTSTSNVEPPLAGNSGPDEELKTKSNDDEALSKSDARKLRKEQRKEQRRMLAKESRSERKKAAKKRKQEARLNLLASMSAEERTNFIEAEREAGRVRKADWEATLKYAYEKGRPRVVINCSFSNTLDVRELTSLAKQVQLSYTHVRDSRSKVQLHVTSLEEGNPALRSLEGVGFQKWTLHTHEKSVWDVFPTEAKEGKLVILTPDAEEDLEEVLEEEIYVIGGIVDRSVNKHLSMSQAQEKGATKIRKLPLKKFGPAGVCPVLNIDCVVRMLCGWLKRGGDWQGVIEECLPGRRLGDRPTLSRKERRQKRMLERAKEGGANVDADQGHQRDSSGEDSSDEDGENEDEQEDEDDDSNTFGE